MAIGDSYQTAIESYFVVFAETTYGTSPSSAATNGTAIDVISSSIKTEIESEKLDTFGLTRGFLKRVQLNKNVSGEIEGYLHPIDSPLLIAQALGGGITTSSLTSGAFTHSIAAGAMDTAPTSLTFKIKKGDTPFEYWGGRVNSLKISANAGEPVMMTAELIFKDSTQTGSDLASTLSLSTVLPFTFVDGVYQYDSTEGSLTSSVAETIQGFELTINNNLVSDAPARALGSNVLSVLPPTRREVEFQITQRFDTTTGFNRFTAGTAGAAQLVFTGVSITAEANFQTIIVLPKIYVSDAEPELGGSGEVLSADIKFDVTVDTGTSSGRDIGVTVINNVSSY